MFFGRNIFPDIITPYKFVFFLIRVVILRLMYRVFLCCTRLQQNSKHPASALTYSHRISQKLQLLRHYNNSPFCTLFCSTHAEEPIHHKTPQQEERTHLCGYPLMARTFIDSSLWMAEMSLCLGPLQIHMQITGSTF